MATRETVLAYERVILPLMIVLRTAEPNAPPSARAENATPVAVERKAWGDVNCTRAGKRVRGPA